MKTTNQYVARYFVSLFHAVIFLVNLTAIAIVAFFIYAGYNYSQSEGVSFNEGARTVVGYLFLPEQKRVILENAVAEINKANAEKVAAEVKVQALEKSLSTSIQEVGTCSVKLAESQQALKSASVSLQDAHKALVAKSQDKGIADQVSEKVDSAVSAVKGWAK